MIQEGEVRWQTSTLLCLDKNGKEMLTLKCEQGEGG